MSDLPDIKSVVVKVNFPLNVSFVPHRRFPVNAAHRQEWLALLRIRDELCGLLMCLARAESRDLMRAFAASKDPICLFLHRRYFTEMYFSVCFPVGIRKLTIR